MIARRPRKATRRRFGVLRRCIHGPARGPAAIHDCICEFRAAQYSRVDEHGRVEGSALCGIQGRFLQRLQHLRSGCRKRPSLGGLPSSAELDRARLQESHPLQRPRQRRHFAAWEQPQLFSEEVRAGVAHLPRIPRYALVLVRTRVTRVQRRVHTADDSARAQVLSLSAVGLPIARPGLLASGRRHGRPRDQQVARHPLAARRPAASCHRDRAS